MAMGWSLPRLGPAAGAEGIGERDVSGGRHHDGLAGALHEHLPVQPRGALTAERGDEPGDLLEGVALAYEDGIAGSQRVEAVARGSVRTVLRKMR